MLFATLLLVAPLVQDPEATLPRLDIEGVLEVSLPPMAQAEGEPSSEAAFRMSVTAGRRYVLWAESSDCDPTLIIERADGRPVTEDHDCGGATTAYVKLDASTDSELVVRVSNEASVAGVIRVHTLPTPLLDDAGREALEWMRAGLSAVGEDVKAENRSAASQAIPYVREAWDAIPNGSLVEEPIVALWDFAWGAGQVGQKEYSAEAYALVVEFQRRALPKTHPDRLQGINDLEVAQLALGDIEASIGSIRELLGLRIGVHGSEAVVVQQDRLRLALRLTQLQRFEEAGELVDLALAAFAGQADSPTRWVSVAIGLQAEILSRIDDPTGATERLEPIVKRMRAGQDYDAQLYHALESTLARMFQRLGRPKQAQESARQLYSRVTENGAFTALERAAASQLVASLLYGEQSYREALPFCEEAWETYSQQLPRMDEAGLSALSTYSSTLNALGSFRLARDLQELEVSRYVEMGQADEFGGLKARGNLANTIFKLGEFRTALEECQVLVDAWRKLPPRQRANGAPAFLILARCHWQLGEAERGIPLMEESVSLLEEMGGYQASWLRRSDATLADLYAATGRYHEAQAVLSSRLVRAQELHGKDSPLVLGREVDLAKVLALIGDHEVARAMLSQVLARSSRTLPADHEVTLDARHHLAGVLQDLSRLDEAEVLLNQLVDHWRQVSGEESHDYLSALHNLAGNHFRSKDIQGAFKIQESVLRIRERTLPTDHVDLLKGLSAMALMKLVSQEYQEARALQSRVVNQLRSSTHELDEYRVSSLIVLAQILFFQKDWDALRPLVQELVGLHRKRLMMALPVSSPREMEVYVAMSGLNLDQLLSMTAAEAPEEFREDLSSAVSCLVMQYHDASLQVSRCLSLELERPELREIRSRAQAAGQRVVEAAAAGRSSEDVMEWTRERDSLLRDLAKQRREAGPGGDLVVPLSIDGLASALGPNSLAVSFREYSPLSPVLIDDLEATTQSRLVAHVIEGNGEFTRLELGEVGPVADASREFVLALIEEDQDQVKSSGAALAKQVIEPLRDMLVEARRLIFVTDGPLRQVPLELLPTPEGFLGDKYTVEFRSTLWELMAPTRTPEINAEFVLMGGVAYDEKPAPLETEEDRGPEASGSPGLGQVGLDETILRSGSPERGFAALTHSKKEVMKLAESYEERGGVSTVFTGRAASRLALLRHASKARFLHIATHAFYATQPESGVRRAEPVDAILGAVAFPGMEEVVLELAPLSLTGLVLAGGNLTDEDTGRVEGVLTAEELSLLDLSGCELAVLSACETSLGVQRDGQGLASLQRALQMAGARSVITSRWKVNDENTEHFMQAFYSRLWGEPQLSTSEVLWRAKMEMYAERMPYRDWAAWVLTGEPD